MKFEIRNPKLEANSKFQLQSSIPHEKPASFAQIASNRWKTFRKVEFVSSFEFRISNFAGKCFSNQQIHFRALVPLLLIGLLTTACRRDMFHQPSSKPLEQSQFF